jgi:RNA polymerase sigma-70 factor (ECF subfamily)
VARVLRIVPSRGGDDADLVAALRAREAWAAAALVARHADHVRRILMRVLGGDDEQSDLAQEVFTRALAGIDRLDDPGAIRGWLTNIAVFTAREAIRRRRRRRWLLPFGDRPPEVAAAWADPGLREAARCVYRVLAEMPVE